MGKYKVILVPTTMLIILYLIISVAVGEVTIIVKDSISDVYIKNVNISMKPDLTGIAGPGTDGAGPFVYELRMPRKTKITVSASGYKDKSVDTVLIPPRRVVIYLEPITNQ